MKLKQLNRIIMTMTIVETTNKQKNIFFRKYQILQKNYFYFDTFISRYLNSTNQTEKKNIPLFKSENI